MSKKQSEKEKNTPQNNTSKSLGKRRFVVMILSILFVIGGVAILRLHRPEATPASFARPVKTIKPFAPIATRTVPEKTPATETVVETVTTQPETDIEDVTPAPATAPAWSTPTETPIEPITAVEPEKTTEQTTPTEPTQTMAAQALPKALEKHILLAAGTAKLGDMLALRDDFANNDPCVTGYQNLLTLEPRTPLLQNAIDALTPFCTKPEPVLQSLTQTFSKSKKRAIMAYYKAKYPRWWFIKAIPVSVIEIRRLNPKNSRPIDNLYRAHNALLRQDIEQSIRFIDALPPLMRTQMEEYVHVAKLYNNARTALDAVILSFEKGE